MHILLALLSALGAVAFFVIRANYAAQAARDLGDAATEVKGLVRRSRWKRRTKVDHIRAVRNPRLAAAVMMCAMAKSDGDLSQCEVAAILCQLRGPLGLADAEAKEILAEARWLTGDMKELSAMLRRASTPIQALCSDDERAELIQMLTAVAEADGPANDIQRDALDRLRRELGLNRH